MRQSPYYLWNPGRFGHHKMHFTEKDGNRQKRIFLRKRMWFFKCFLPRDKILPSRKKNWPSVRKKRFKIKQAIIRKISGREKNEPSWDFQNRCKKAWFFWGGLKNKSQKYISKIFEKRPVKTPWYFEPHYLWNLTPLKRHASSKQTVKNPKSLSTTTTNRFWDVQLFGK